MGRRGTQREWRGEGAGEEEEEGGVEWSGVGWGERGPTPASISRSLPPSHTHTHIYIYAQTCALPSRVPFLCPLSTPLQRRVCGYFSDFFLFNDANEFRRLVAGHRHPQPRRRRRPPPPQSPPPPPSSSSLSAKVPHMLRTRLWREKGREGREDDLAVAPVMSVARVSSGVRCAGRCWVSRIRMCLPRSVSSLTCCIVG